MVADPAEGFDIGMHWCITERHRGRSLQRPYWLVFQSERLRHGLVGDAAVVDVGGGEERRRLTEGGLDAELGELQDPGEGDVAEGEGAGAADGTRHVGDAIMQDAFFEIRGIAVRCWSARFDAAALVDGDVDDDAAGLHELQVLKGDETWRFGAGNEHGTNDEVGQAELLADGVAVAVEDVDVGRHNVVEVAEPVHVDIEDGDVGLEAGGDFGGVGTDDAAAEDRNVSWGDAGHAGEQDSAAELRLFEVFGPFLDAHAAGDFAHRR